MGSVNEVRQRYEAVRADYDNADKQKKKADDDTEDFRSLLIKLKLRSSDIKTNKEYFAHLKEIEDCEKKITELEDRSLEMMEKMDGLKEELGKATEAYEAEKEVFEQDKKKIEDGFAGDNARLKTLTAKRDKLLSDLPKELARQYNHVAAKYPDNAVTRAMGGACTGCRMMMPPQAFNNVRKSETVHTCSNCHRILYYAGEDE